MAKFINWSDVENALHSILNNDDAGAWVLVGYHGTTNELSLVAQGRGGVEELKQNLDNSTFQYGLIRLANRKELEHSNKITFKDIFCAFQGSQVSIMKRGKMVEHLGSVQSKFEPNHAQLIVKNFDLVTEALLLAKADPKSGSHLIE